MSCNLLVKMCLQIQIHSELFIQNVTVTFWLDTQQTSKFFDVIRNLYLSITEVHTIRTKHVIKPTDSHSTKRIIYLRYFAVIIY